MGNDQKVEIYDSAKEASSLIMDTYRSAEKELMSGSRLGMGLGCHGSLRSASSGVPVYDSRGTPPAG